MDFWTRLVGGAGSTPIKIPTAPSAEQRLANFKREYSQALQTWNKALIKSPKPEDLVTLSAGLHRLTILLQNDARAPAPHFCITYATSTYVYKAVTRVALSLKNEDIFRETIAFLARFVDSDVDAVLGADKFADTLLTYAERLLEPSDFVISVITEEEVLELLFNVVAKLRVQPEFVQAWFKPESDTTLNTDPTVSETLFESPDELQAFPLCRLLISRAHHDDKVGDFARTGMLYLFECATRSPQLEDWIVESELPTLMASGLGALYSHLSRKVTIAHPDENMPLVLALSEGHRLLPSSEAESVYSKEFHSRLSTFLQHLVFWQDVLDHCTSARIKKTLEEHFHSLFLQQILYPSLLQSSDVDGGSSVAVLTYCWRVLEVLHHPDLIYLFLNYLLALQDTSPPKSTFCPALQSPDQLDPSFFSLVDLLLDSIRSSDSETKTAALRVTSIILHQHHWYAIGSLVTINAPKSRKTRRALGALNIELDMLLSIAQQIGGDDGMDRAYENSLKDALALVESHVCSQEILSLRRFMPHRKRDTMEEMTKTPDTGVKRHCINLKDSLLHALLFLLEDFFTNDIEVNLSLTAVFAHLASCQYVSLEGWLAVNPSQYVKIGKRGQHGRREDLAYRESTLSDDLDDMERQRVDAYNLARNAPSWLAQSEPLLVKVLRDLSKQLEKATSEIPDFDSIVSSRKRAFEGALELEEGFAEATPESRGNRFEVRHRQVEASIITTPQRGRTSKAVFGKDETPTSSPKPLEPRSFPWLPNSPLLLLSSQLREDARHHGTTERTGSPLPKGRTPLQRDQSARKQREANSTERKVIFKPLRDAQRKASAADIGNTEPIAQNSTAASVKAVKNREASLSHVATNVVLLQEFIMEMAAIIQVRSALFDGELRFV